MIDVASGEYGYEYVDKMIALVDNGRCSRWSPGEGSDEKSGSTQTLSHSSGQSVETLITSFEEDINPEHLKARSSNWQQFCTLYKRRTTQMWRDSVSRWQICPARYPKKKLIVSISFPELHEIANLYDIFLGSRRWWYLPRHRQRCIESTLQFRILFHRHHSVHVQSTDASIITM